MGTGLAGQSERRNALSKQSLSKVYRLLEFLKKNTDKNHPATQAKLREMAGDELSAGIMGDKGTFSRRLRELSDVYNRDERGEILPQASRKIVFPGFDKPEGSNSKNGKIYYNHEVSDYEMDLLVKLIRETPCLTHVEKESLEERLISTLCSKYYKPFEGREGALIRSVNVRIRTDPEDTVADDTATDDENSEIEESLKIIRENILRKRMLEFDVRYPDSLGREREKSIRVSPYRLLYSNGLFWMIGNWHERPIQGEKFCWYTDDLTAIRVDKMSYIKTAHTPDETYIHWCMTNYHLLPRQSHTRISYANRETKARYNEYILRALEKLDSMEEVELEHMEDLD